MALLLKVRPIGSSLGVILPKRELELRGVGAGDYIEIGKLRRPAHRELFGVWREQPAAIVREAPEEGNP